MIHVFYLSLIGSAHVLRKTSSNRNPLQMATLDAFSLSLLASAKECLFLKGGM